MKTALPLLLLLSLASTHANDLIIWREKIDTRPFLVRLVLSIGLALEVGADKARLKVDRGGANVACGTNDGSLAIRSVMPESYAVTAKFGTDF
jgi:hypothetical protein